MNFGNAFNNKIGLMNSAVAGATGAANSASGNAGFQGVNTALNSGSTANNFGLGTFNPTQANANVTIPTNFADSIFSALGGNASASKSVGSSGSAQGGVSCCFIFLEALNGTLPWWVRKCRDEYYTSEPMVATGYKRMAKWLVPMMKWIPGIKFMVNRWMVQPLILYGGWLKMVEGCEDCESFVSYKNFWFAVWRKLGKGQ